MGYSLVKYLDSAEYHRALFYLDRGESDLPKVDQNTYAMGSRAISQSTGQEWFLDTNFEWKPVRNCIGSKIYEKNKYGGNEFEISPKVKEVQITPTKLTMNRNSSAQLSGTTIGDDIFDKRVRWEILSSVSGGTYITQDGFVHVGDYKKPAVISVRAISLTDDKVYKDIQIQVDPFGELIGEVYSIDITPNQPTIGIGQSLQFVGTVNGNGSYDKDVIWSISASSDSYIGEDGKLVVGTNEKYPVIIVTARSVFDNRIFAAMPVVIKAIGKAPTIASVDIVPHEMKIGPGCFASLVALVKGTGDYIEDVKWEVEASSPDTMITKSGILIVGSDELEGEITVRATSVIDETKMDEVTYEISKSVLPTTKKVLGVIITPDTFSIYKSYNAIFFANVVGINIYDHRIKWSIERNSSDYTKIKDNGSFVVASEEDSNSVVVKATSVADPSIFGLAAVEILNFDDGDSPSPTPTPTGDYIIDLVIDANKNLIAIYNNETEKIVGKVSGGVFTPHITQDEKVLSFMYAETPGRTPSPVDLKVDLSAYALKSQIITDEDLTAAQDVGGVEKDRFYPEETPIRTIVKDMLKARPTPPVTDILLYKGATTEIPQGIEELSEMPGYTKEDLLENKLTTTIPVEIDPETEEGQYPVLAVGNDLRLIKWNQAAAPDFPTNSFIRIDKGDYSLYYLTNHVTKDIEYLFTFEEV